MACIGRRQNHRNKRHIICGEAAILRLSSGKIGLLSSMYTDPAYRRRGIAKELLRRIMEEARAFGCETVQITASDMGVLLYTDFGFKKNGNFMQDELEKT